MRTAKNNGSKISLINPRQKANGFTFMEMIVVVLLIALSTTWAWPQFQRKREQGILDRYHQNLTTGLLNLKKRLQKTSKTCTLFPGVAQAKQGKYIEADKIIELNQLKRVDYLDCIFDQRDRGLEKDIPFRYLQREGTTERNSAEILISRNNFQLNNLGANIQGDDITFRIRSKQWEKQNRLLTRCIVYSGNGHIFKGTWSYTQSKCFEYCPKGDNCNQA